MAKIAPGFGKRLKIALDFRGKSEGDLAQALGVRQQAVNNWVHEKTGSKKLYEAAAHLGINPDWLYENVGEMLPVTLEIQQLWEAIHDPDDKAAALRTFRSFANKTS